MAYLSFLHGTTNNQSRHNNYCSMCFNTYTHCIIRHCFYSTYVYHHLPPPPVAVERRQRRSGRSVTSEDYCNGPAQIHEVPNLCNMLYIKLAFWWAKSGLDRGLTLLQVRCSLLSCAVLELQLQNLLRDGFVLVSIYKHAKNNRSLLFLYINVLLLFIIYYI